MNRTLRSFKYIFLQTEVIFLLVVGLGLFIEALFAGFIQKDSNVNTILSSLTFNMIMLGIMMLALLLGSYYQMLCPFYLTFSTTRKTVYLSMKVMGFLPLIQLFLLGLILQLFSDEGTRATTLATYPGLVGLAFIGLAFGECMGAISLRFVKFGRIFPAILGGIGGAIGGFCASFFDEIEHTLTMVEFFTKYANQLLLIGIPLYIIVNIFVYLVMKKLTAH